MGRLPGAAGEDAGDSSGDGSEESEKNGSNAEEKCVFVERHFGIQNYTH